MLDTEITVRIQAASSAVGRLRERMFCCRELSLEIWALYRRQIKKLRTIQQRPLRSILKVKWYNYITNDEVLDRAMAEDIENILIRNRLCWVGQIVRLPDDRPTKVLLYGQLAQGSRKTGRALLRYKDTIKDILNLGGPLHAWRDAVMERTEWRKCIHDISKKIDTERKD